MEILLQDIRYALRTLYRNPALASMAVISLALGIGANSAVFSIVKTVLLSPLPYKDPAQLVLLNTIETGPSGAPQNNEWWSHPHFRLIEERNDVFEQVAAVSDDNFNLVGAGDTERLKTEIVSSSYFPLLGVNALVGRTFLPEEDKPSGNSAVIILSHGLWQRRFGSDPKVLGQTVSLNKVPLTIVGVLPEGFKGLSGDAEIWVPVMMTPALMNVPRRLTLPFAGWLQILGRLKPGVDLAQAQAAMQGMSGQIDAAYPPPPDVDKMAIDVIPLNKAKIDPQIRRSFIVLFIAVGLVLLIACANITNLLLAKMASQKKEIAIRVALGASRSHLIRQFLTESLVLTFLGGVLGLLIAYWGIDLLVNSKPVSNSPFWANYQQALRFFDVHLDGQAFAFNFIITLMAGLMVGLFPALRASRADLNEVIKGSGHGTIESTGGMRRVNSRNSLVVAEVALTLVLLIGAGLMIKSLFQMQATKIGFDPSNVITMRINMLRSDFSQQKSVAFYNQLLERVAAFPQVQSVSISSSTPLSSNTIRTRLTIEGRPPLPRESKPIVDAHIISPDYFKTLGIKFLRGREFNDADRAGVKRVAIINDAAARAFWEGEDPVGQRIFIGLGWEPDGEFAEIVGIADDVKYGKIEDPVRPAVYVTYEQYMENTAFLLAHTSGPPAALAPALRNEVIALNKDLPIYDIKTMEERAASSLSKARLNALLLGVFATFALVLSAVGIYGVVAYSVSKRKYEMGIRLALGALPGDVLRLVLWQSATLAVIGVAIGLAAALVLTRVLSNLLYGVSVTDPLIFLITSALLLLVALAASYFPARKASKLDPMLSIRYE